MERFPGFDFLRILAAASVIFSHSFLIMDGVDTNEPFKSQTGAILGVYGVFIFSILSGFLVSDSARRSISVTQFALKRLRRLVPGFVVCNLIAVTVICSAYAINGRHSFLTDPATWTHLLSVLFFWSEALYYPSVAFFTSTSPADTSLPHVVNGGLWTIRLAASFYLIVAVMYVFRLLTPLPILAVGCLAAAMALAWPFHATKFLSGFSFLLPSFAAGMILREFAFSHRADGRVALASFIVLAVLLASQGSNWAPWTMVVFPLLSAYPLLWFGQLDSRFLRGLSRCGDPSYGMYLWGWPLLMVLRPWAGDTLSAYLFFALCLPVVIFAGYLSWHLVERPFLARRSIQPAGMNRKPVEES